MSTLKSLYGPDIPRKIAAMIQEQYPAFDAAAFLRDSLRGYEALELTPRAGHICDALRKHLPQDYPDAIAILIASVGPPLESTEKFGMAPFIYLPHVLFVARYGVGHFEESMHAQHVFTQRFSAEFSIRVFLDRYPDKTLERLKEWTADPSPHVRRLVSEGTRPRLPWAPRLRAFQRDPTPLLKLLEILRDDPELYVRRSVANNLNDIGKDHPALLAAIARVWMIDASPERRALVSHALRSLVKKGDGKALKVMGFGRRAVVSISKVRIAPARAKLGGSVTIGFEVKSIAKSRQQILVDYRVHFVKAGGKTSAKVFKLTKLDLGRSQSAQVQTKLSLRQMTTRKHFRGVHKVEAIINGETRKLGKFEIV